MISGLLLFKISQRKDSLVKPHIHSVTSNTCISDGCEKVPWETMLRQKGCIELIRKYKVSELSLPIE